MRSCAGRHCRAAATGMIHTRAMGRLDVCDGCRRILENAGEALPMSASLVAVTLSKTASRPVRRPESPRAYGQIDAGPSLWRAQWPPAPSEAPRPAAPPSRPSRPSRAASEPASTPPSRPPKAAPVEALPVDAAPPPSPRSVVRRDLPREVTEHPTIGRPRLSIPEDAILEALAGHSIREVASRYALSRDTLRRRVAEWQGAA